MNAFIMDEFASAWPGAVNVPLPAAAICRSQRAKELLALVLAGPLFIEPHNRSIFTAEQARSRYRRWAEMWVVHELLQLIPELNKASFLCQKSATPECRMQRATELRAKLACGPSFAAPVDGSPMTTDDVMNRYQLWARTYILDQLDALVPELARLKK
jgi:hypothetical protein